jgi:hypothetical protein
MSKHSKIRENKTCENCNCVVSDRYCGNCGQENVVLNKSFVHLLKHFFEDITHYDSAFWKTLKLLFFHPGFLSIQFLKGKRVSYLAPVRLYIFASFITFFLLNSFTGSEHEKKSQNNQASSQNPFLEFEENSNVKKLDSIQTFGKENEKLNLINYWLKRKIYTKMEEIPKDELWSKFSDSFIHNIPKGLFVYMPIFSLILWFFHNKKKWYYFDHAIFTIHYFSFLLLASLTNSCFSLILNYFPDESIFSLIDTILSIVILCYTFVYYFIAHKKFYKENKRTTIIKGFSILIINLFFIVLTIISIAIYSLINIH